MKITLEKVTDKFSEDVTYHVIFHQINLIRTRIFNDETQARTLYTKVEKELIEFGKLLTV